MVSKDKYDRVTAVLSPFSGIDKIPKAILNAAAERGSRVHAICQGLIDKLPIDVPEDIKGYVDSFMQWKEGKHFFPNPGRMYDDELMITGECDGVVRYTKGSDSIIFDLKTSQKEGKTWKLQGAAYGRLAQCGTQVFLILDKNGSQPTEFFYDSAENWQQFEQCLDIYRKFFKTRNPIDERFL